MWNTHSVAHGLPGRGVFHDLTWLDSANKKRIVAYTTAVERAVGPELSSIRQRQVSEKVKMQCSLSNLSSLILR